MDLVIIPPLDVANPFPEHIQGRKKTMLLFVKLSYTEGNKSCYFDKDLSHA